MVFPAATVTLAGTLATAVFELNRVTTKPPVGAGPVKRTVPITAVVDPPFTDVGATVSETKVAG